MYGDQVYTDGFKVYTTVVSHMQEIANQTVRDQLLSYDQRHSYRGPENNFGMPSLKLMEQWEHKLNSLPVINGLEPAVVIDITAQSVTALRANGSLTTYHGPDYRGQENKLMKIIYREHLKLREKFLDSAI